MSGAGSSVSSDASDSSDFSDSIVSTINPLLWQGSKTGRIKWSVAAFRTLILARIAQLESHDSRHLLSATTSSATAPPMHDDASQVQ